jgi:hypothetical protein
MFRSSKEELGDERRAPKGGDFMDISNTLVTRISSKKKVEVAFVTI